MIKIKRAGGTVLTNKTAISASPMWSSLNLRCPAVISATIRFEQARQGADRAWLDPLDVDTVLAEA